jgi:hypothetical protein
MSTSQSKQDAIAAQAVGLIAGYSNFTVCLQDGRKIVVPYHCYPLLDEADMKQRSHFEVHAEGRLLHWPDIDEDLSTDQVISYLAVTLGYAVGQTTRDEDLDGKLAKIVEMINSGINQVEARPAGVTRPKLVVVN